MQPKSKNPKEPRGRGASARAAGKNGEDPWYNGVQRRRYRFPAPGGDFEEDLAMRIDWDGEGCFFPLGTLDKELAATKGRQIYQLVMKRGWDAACQRFPRELIVSFEWSMNPILWTYITIHTLVGQKAALDSNGSKNGTNRQYVLVVEKDEGISRALCWSINQQAPFGSIPCDSAEAFRNALTYYQPRLVLANRTLIEQLGFPSQGGISPIQRGASLLAYSVHPDGDRMLASAPGGAEGYVFKRVKPVRLLEPILDLASPTGLLKEELLPKVKSYFQTLLRSQSNGDGAPLARLSRREREVLALLSRGQKDKEIAHALGISVWTAHEYVKSIFAQLQVRTRTEAAVRFLEK